MVISKSEGARMFLDFYYLFYDDFLDIIPPKMRKILAIILLTIGALFMLSYSIIDDDFLEIIALLIDWGSAGMTCDCFIFRRNYRNYSR